MRPASDLPTQEPPNKPLHPTVCRASQARHGASRLACYSLGAADPTGDALHLALASFHRCDFLVTRNCTHLANANTFGHMRRVHDLLGLFTLRWSHHSNCPATTTMKNDPAIEAVRKGRREISRELGNDPARLIAHCMERQALITPPLWKASPATCPPTSLDAGHRGRGAVMLRV